MSPREPGRKTSGCYIEKTSTGRGRLCFRWPTGKHGKLYRITTELDAEKDHGELERARDLVGAEIRAGIFEPSRRFPSVFAAKFAMPIPLERRRSLVAAMKTWIDEKEKRKVRPSRVRGYRSHLKNYIEPSPIAALDPMALSLEELRRFQLWLVSEAGLSEAGEAGKGAGVGEKTAANVIRGTLRAFVRDIDGSLAGFTRLTWERLAPTREQDPFETDERDRILAWFRKRRSFEEYVSLRLRFLGVSPSEARGFNVGDFDRRNQALAVNRSRHLGVIGATKTRARQRPVFLGPEITAEVATVVGLRERDEQLLRVAEDTLRDAFNKAQKVLGIRPRSLYQTKHTFAIRSLLDGWSPAALARNLGISLATLERSYAVALTQGRVMGADSMPMQGNPRRGVSAAVRGNSGGAKDGDDDASS